VALRDETKKKKVLGRRKMYPPLDGEIKLRVRKEI
jgi:hypothetical protein